MFDSDNDEVQVSELMNYWHSDVISRQCKPVEDDCLELETPRFTVFTRPDSLFGLIGR